MQANAGRRRAILAALTLLLSTVATLLVLEGALRLRRGSLWSPSPTAPPVRMVGGYPAVWDARLGWVPRPNTEGRNNPWRKIVTIDADGLRSSGSLPPRGDGGSVLAVGDSFTFGDQVNDLETWPAALQRRIGRRVSNGGVFGYGVDQMVLRAEALLASGGYETLVVSFIPDDVARCEYGYRYGHKPWFELEDGRLVLRNEPVPRPEEPPPGENAFRQLLRRSFLAELVVHRLDPAGWLIRGSVRVHRDGPRVARALVDRIADETDRRGVRLLLVAAWHPGAYTKPAELALARAEERGVPVLRLEPVLREQIETRGGWTDLFLPTLEAGVRRPGHMTGLGNGIVAQSIADALR
jgi:hypothetical protein